VNVISLCVICVLGTGASLLCLLRVKTLTVPGSMLFQFIITKSSLSHCAGDNIPVHAATHVQLYPLTDIGCAGGSVAGTVSD
jgi:hypothetical protein